MTNRATSRFPAILIGGPPHAGKSVLSYSLRNALTKAKTQCYVLRAAPDGEGNWSQEADPVLVQKLRDKGIYTRTWIEYMCLDIAFRPLPFLVDVGGQPKFWQERVFDYCTHAILLTKDTESRTFWQAMANKYNLLVIADLTSQPHGKPVVQVERPILKGVITELERNQQASGPVFEILLDRVKALFRYEYDELLNTHQAQSPIDQVLDIPTMYRQFYPNRSRVRWQPQDLLKVLDYIPPDRPLALYGIGPTWLYAAVANHISPTEFYQFDARRRWVKPVSLMPGPIMRAPLIATIGETELFLYLHLDLTEDYLVYMPEIKVTLPPGPQNKGIILSGKLPNWLYTGLTLHYRQVPWVALYYPPANQAVIVSSHQTTGRFTVGQVIDMAGYESSTNSNKQKIKPTGT